MYNEDYNISYSVDRSGNQENTNAASVYKVFGQCKRKIHNHIFCHRFKYFKTHVTPKLEIYNKAEIATHIKRLDRLKEKTIELLDLKKTVQDLESFTDHFLKKTLSREKKFLDQYTTKN